MLQYNSTKRNKIKLTGHDNNDKFSGKKFNLIVPTNLVYDRYYRICHQ